MEAQKKKERKREEKADARRSELRSRGNAKNVQTEAEVRDTNEPAALDTPSEAQHLANDEQGSDLPLAASNAGVARKSVSWAPGAALVDVKVYTPGDRGDPLLVGDANAKNAAVMLLLVIALTGGVGGARLPPTPHKVFPTAENGIYMDCCCDCDRKAPARHIALLVRVALTLSRHSRHRPVSPPVDVVCVY